MQICQSLVANQSITPLQINNYKEMPLQSWCETSQMKHSFEFSGFGVFVLWTLFHYGHVHVPACSVLWFNLFSSQNPKAQVIVSNEICPSSLCQTFHSFVFLYRNIFNIHNDKIAQKSTTVDLKKYLFTIS